MLEPATTNVAYCTAFGPLGMDKPVLTTVPLRYTFGTHSAVALSPGGPGHKAFSCHSMHSDEQLFNLHLKCIDLTAWQHGQKAPFGEAQFRLLRLLGRARWFWPASTPRGRQGPWAPVPKLGRSSEPPPVKAPLVADAISLPSFPQAWTEELMDSDRRPKGAAANASSVSAFMQARCYRSQPKGIHPVPQRLRVF